MYKNLCILYKYPDGTSTEMEASKSSDSVTREHKGE